MSVRADLVASAVSFLRDPSARSSPLQQRIEFLRSKGLTQPEIDQAFAAAASDASNTATTRYGQHYPQFERDWRDWFIMTVVAGSAGVAAYALLKKYVIPHLQPPSTTALSNSEAALTAKYDEATLLLTTLSTSHAALLESIDEQRKDVELELENVRRAVREMREGEKGREEWCTKVKGLVDEVTKGLPKMLEKNSSSQLQSLADLSTELKSLKSLLLTRTSAASAATPSSASLAANPVGSAGGSQMPNSFSMPAFPSPSPPPPSSSPSAVTASLAQSAAAASPFSYSPSSSPFSTTSLPSSSSTPSLSTSATIPATTATTTSNRASSFGLRQPGIPAWQLKGNSAAGFATPGGPPSSSSSTSTSAPSSLATTAVAAEPAILATPLSNSANGPSTSATEGGGGMKIVGVDPAAAATAPGSLDAGTTSAVNHLGAVTTTANGIASAKEE